MRRFLLCFFGILLLLIIALVAALFTITPTTSSKTPVVVTSTTNSEQPLVLTTTTTPNLNAEAAYSVYIDGQGNETVLFEKNKNEALHIASVTKLMTAYTVLRSIPKDTTITISQAAVNQYETAGHLEKNQSFTRDELLYPLLIESSNDAAYAFAESVGVTRFIARMNDYAKLAGMTQTTFTNAHGIDASSNYSSALDVARMAKLFYTEYPSVFPITALPSFQLHTIKGDYDRLLITTDKLLQNSQMPLTIIGGKTGETPDALQALVLILKSPRNEGYIINVILHSKDRDADMIALSTWLRESYTW